MADEKKGTPTIQEQLAELPGKIFRREALALITAAILGAAATSLAQGKFDVSVSSRVDAGVAPLEAKLTAHIEEEAHRRAEFEKKLERVLDGMQVLEERSARRFDALQLTVLERREQPDARELSRPAPMRDGGAP